MAIITNYQPRPTFSWWDLSDKEKAKLDWLETEEEQCSVVFFRYRRQVYCLDEFVTPNSPHHLDWDGVAPETFYSGVIVKYIHGLNDEIIVGYYYL